MLNNSCDSQATSNIASHIKLSDQFIHTFVRETVYSRWVSKRAKDNTISKHST